MLKDVKFFMELAIDQAKLAAKIKEIPVGAIITVNNKVISSGFNMREKLNNSLAHAEIIAINAACRRLKSWRILNSAIYVTLEPCIMCFGAILNSKIENIVFGAKSVNSEACISNNHLKEICRENKVNIISGVCEKDCKDILSSFFKRLRK